MNNKALNLAGVSEADYRQWCKNNHKNVSSPASKSEFFAKIQEGRLVKDSKGQLVKKYRRK